MRSEMRKEKKANEYKPHTMTDPEQKRRSQRMATRRHKGEATALANHGNQDSSSISALHSASQEVNAEDASSASASTITCVGFKILLWNPEMSEEERAHNARLEDRLWILRGWMHWLMNCAADGWRYADKRPSLRDATKEVRDRGEVTEAVKNACESQRTYAAEQLAKAEQGLEKIRVNLGSAKARNNVETIATLEKALSNEMRRMNRLRDASELIVPSSVRDVVVVRAEDAFKKWAKNKGAMAYPSFRHGQPIRFRDGDWSIEKTEKRGIYKLTVPIGGEKRHIERASFMIVPDSGSAHAFAKMMVDGRTKNCDAKITYSEKKRQWFAGLTIKYSRIARPPVTTGGTCALRLGVHNAVVLAFDTGDVDVIRGADLIAYKARLRARYDSIRSHLRSREAGSGAKGRGAKRRFKALTKMAEREENHVNTTMGRWAHIVLERMQHRGASRICVALEPGAMVDSFETDKSNKIVAAYLAKFPRAKLRDAIEKVVTEDGRSFVKTQTSLDAKTCPECGHRHEKRPTCEMFHCEVCGAAAPTDTIAAWNLINTVVGSKIPFRERLKKRAEQINASKKET